MGDLECKFNRYGSCLLSFCECKAKSCMYRDFPVSEEFMDEANRVMSVVEHWSSEISCDMDKYEEGLSEIQSRLKRCKYVRNNLSAKKILADALG